MINNGELYAAALNVQHTFSSITLGVNRLRGSIAYNFSRHPSRIEKSLGIERTGRFADGFLTQFCQRPALETTFRLTSRRFLPIGQYNRKSQVCVFFPCGLGDA